METRHEHHEHQPRQVERREKHSEHQQHHELSGWVSISRRTDLDAHRMSIGGQMNVNMHARKAGDWQQLEWLGAFQGRAGAFRGSAWSGKMTEVIQLAGRVDF